MRQNGTTRTCPQCGTQFYIWPSIDRKYCSRACYRKAQRTGISVPCETCGVGFHVAPSRFNRGKGRFCSLKCRGASTRVERQMDSNGYPLIWTEDGRHMREHRYVAEQMIGRPLLPSEHVHHVNEDRSDNRPENLRVVTKSEHMTIHHGIDRWSREYDQCIRCGDTSRRYAGNGLCGRCYNREYSRRVNGTSPDRYRV